MKKLRALVFRYVFREQNRVGDALAKEGVRESFFDVCNRYGKNRYFRNYFC